MQVLLDSECVAHTPRVKSCLTDTQANHFSLPYRRFAGGLRQGLSMCSKIGTRQYLVSGLLSVAERSTSAHMHATSQYPFFLFGAAGNRLLRCRKDRLPASEQWQH